MELKLRFAGNEGSVPGTKSRAGSCANISDLMFRSDPSATRTRYPDNSRVLADHGAFGSAD